LGNWGLGTGDWGLGRGFYIIHVSSITNYQLPTPKKLIVLALGCGIGQWMNVGWSLDLRGTGKDEIFYPSPFINF
jgi:hypothetical protein